MGVLDRYEALELDLTEAYEMAQQRASLAGATEGQIPLRSAARARSDHPTVTLMQNNIMGVRIPHIEYAPPDRNFDPGIRIHRDEPRH